MERGHDQCSVLEEENHMKRVGRGGGGVMAS